MIRLFDLVLSTIGMVLLFPVFGFLFLLGLFDTGAPLLRQVRVGVNQRHFVLIKFRTMHVETKSVATHLVDPSSVTSLGRLLRKSKLDELPQLWNVFMGDMSLVGPRPCLPNQRELIGLRAKYGLFKMRPGITGLAQINGVDMSAPELLAETEAQMMRNMTPSAYFNYILKTLAGKGIGDCIDEKPK